MELYSGTKDKEIDNNDKKRIPNQSVEIPRQLPGF